METKILEIADEGTTIIVLAFKFRDLTEWEQWAVARAGYGQTPEARDWYVGIADLNGGIRNRCTTDPYDWPVGGTMWAVHNWLRDDINHWDGVSSGDVVDVRVLNGTRAIPRESEFTASDVVEG